MSKKIKHQIAQQVMSSSGIGMNSGVMAILVQKSDERWFVHKNDFPLKIGGDSQVEIGGPAIDWLEKNGVVQRSVNGVKILLDVLLYVLKKGSLSGGTTTTTTTTTTGVSEFLNKKTTNTYLLEVGHPSGEAIAFVDVIGPRARKSIIALVSKFSHETAQLVVFELCSKHISGRITGDVVTYAGGIANNASQGLFVPASGLVLADEFDVWVASSKKCASAPDAVEPTLLGGAE